MKSPVLDNIARVKKNIQQINVQHNYKLIAITKTFGLDHFKPLLETGHRHFGENKVQEAEKKWIPIIEKYNDIKLHLVGKLQSNKAKQAVQLFDYIHSLDSLKLAKILDRVEEDLKKKRKYFIQINIGLEHQKTGVTPTEFDVFYKAIKQETKLNVIGLMCIPPVDSSASQFFSIMLDLSKQYNLPELSMGMSSDYLEAIKYQATFIRLGTVLFGKR